MRSRPGVLYPEILGEAYQNLHKTLKLPAPDAAEVREFGGSVGTWPAFGDSVEALKRLQNAAKKLVILSNVDNESLMQTLNGPLAGVVFDAVYTAQDIGTYKPDPRNFEYLLRKVEQDFGVQKEGLLHVGVGLESDAVPAKEFGIASCWISRRGGNEDLKQVEAQTDIGWKFEGMKGFAEAVEKG